MQRRSLLLAPALPAAAFAAAQSPSPYPAAPPKWPNPVIDIHYHPKPTAAANLAHLDGCGVQRAVLLTSISRQADAEAAIAQAPKRFARFTAMDAAKGDLAALRQSAKGAIGFGELKSHVACDGPEMDRIYSLAADLGLPVLLHFGEYEQYPGEGTFNTGLARFGKVLAKYPRTLFIGHADFFWANISGEVPAGTPYPTGPVKPGGLTGKLLADYPNLAGDLSANSCRNALARDPDFTRAFLERHQEKLMFGSDCSCSDGRGTGQRSTAPLIRGRCVARETLTALHELSTPAVFRKLTLANATRLLKL